MAIVANTFTRYSAIGMREDLSNVIYNISPEETPFVSNIRRDAISNTFTEWQVDELAAAAVNKQLEGDDISSFTAVTPTSRLGNYTQIMRKDLVISETVEAVTTAGRSSDLAYSLAKVGAELKRDIEFNVLSNTVAAAGSTTAARTTAGLPAFIRTNTSKGGGSGADPTVANGIVNVARVDGTQRAMTEAMLKSTAQKVWVEGGTPRMVLCGAHVKTVISGFAGIAGTRFNVNGNKPATIIGAADIYVSDWGNLEIVPGRFGRARDAFVLDPSLCALAVLRPMKTVKLARTGDAEKRMIITELALKVDQQKGLGIVADLSTS